MSRWEERRKKFAAAREFKRLLDRSSLSEASLFVQCEKHGRQARDPYTDRCVLCP